MFQRAKKFVGNHWKKVVFGGIAVQVASYGVRYAANRFVEYQEDQAKIYWQKVKRQQYFESIDGNCIATFRHMFDMMKVRIGELLDAELIQERLMSNQVDNKLEAWEELKVIAFTRVIVSIYGSSILYILLRIQLSIVGGHLIKIPKFEGPSSSSEPNGTSTRRTFDEAQRKYLDLAQYFASSGIDKIVQYVKNQARSVVGEIPLKQAINASDLEQLIWSVVRKPSGGISSGTDEEGTTDNLGNPTKYPWKYIFPEELLQNQQLINDDSCQPLYRKLICDTYDLLESDDTMDILRYFESQGVSHFIDRISESMKGENIVNPRTDNSPVVFVEPKVVMAKLIPTMTSLHLVDTLDDPWINLLINADCVRVLSANVYEAFCSDDS